jgi:pimeloyl-ACP methyl ester carboxylesterase
LALLLTQTATPIIKPLGFKDNLLVQKTLRMQEDKPETQLVQIDDNRTIAYCEYGDPRGKPVFYFHGTPGSRYEAEFSDQPGKDYGYRIIALDRPGIGRSDYVKKKKLLDWPQDVKKVSNRLGIERFGVIGLSGGGPYALTCGYSLSERLEFTVLMGSWGPVAEEPTLWKEMAPLDRFFGKLSKSAPWAFYVPFSFFGYTARTMSPKGFVKSLGSSMSEADNELMSNEKIARFFAEDVEEAFRQGVRGPADDAIILYGKWGFGVEEVEVEVNLYHGEEDKFAPYSCAIYLDENLPCSKLHGYPGEGHLFAMKLFDKVFEQLSR